MNSELISPINSEFQNLHLYREHSETLMETKGLFLGDGEKVVHRMLESSILVHEILCLEKYLKEEFKEKLILHPEIQKVWVGTAGELKSIRGYDLHQGIMALGKAPSLNKFPSEGPVLVCNRILEANNIGSLIRSAVAMGVNQMILDLGSCHPFIRRSVRVSVGNIFKMNFYRTENLSSTLIEMKSRGYTITGTVARLDSDPRIQSFASFLPTPNTAIVLGNEAFGMDLEVSNLCDVLVNIPMHSGIDSLNVSVAGAILASKWCT